MAFNLFLNEEWSRLQVAHLECLLLGLSSERSSFSWLLQGRLNPSISSSFLLTFSLLSALLRLSLTCLRKAITSSSSMHRKLRSRPLGQLCTYIFVSSLVRTGAEVWFTRKTEIKERDREEQSDSYLGIQICHKCRCITPTLITSLFSLF